MKLVQLQEVFCAFLLAVVLVVFPVCQRAAYVNAVILTSDVYLSRLTVNISLHPSAVLPPLTASQQYQQQTDDAISSLEMLQWYSSRQLAVTIDFHVAFYSQPVYVPPGITQQQGHYYVNPQNNEAGWFGKLALAYPDPSACTALGPRTMNNESWVGKIVLAYRGGSCSNLNTKSENVQASGALAVLIYLADPFPYSSGATDFISAAFIYQGTVACTIPVWMHRWYDGYFLSQILQQDNATLGLTSNVTIFMPGAGPLAPEEHVAYTELVTYLPTYSPPGSGMLQYSDAASLGVDPCVTQVVGIYCKGYPYGHIFNLLNVYVLAGTIMESFANLTYMELAIIVPTTYAQSYFQAQLPSAIGQMTRLIYFAPITGAWVGAVPDSICHCVSLQALIIMGTQFTSVPDCMNNLPNFKRFMVTSPVLAKLPTSLANVPLQRLLIEQATSSAAVPIFNSTNCQLQFVVIEGNSFYAPMPNFAPCTQLVSVNIVFNGLYGSVTNSFDNMPNLLTLNLGNNYLSGSLPTLANGNSIQTIGLGSNQFTGDAPASWSALTAVQSIDMSNNKLTGQFRVLSSLPVMSVLDLSKNEIQLNTSAQLAAMFSQTLLSVDLSHNELQISNIAQNDMNFPALQTLKLAYNQIRCIDANILSLFLLDLVTLDLSYNLMGYQVTCAFLILNPGVFLRSLQIEGNPYYLSGYNGLPSGFSYDTTSYTKANPSQAYVCPGVTMPAIPTFVMNVDPNWYSFQACICDLGFYGYAPNCPAIPSTLTFAPMNSGSSTGSTIPTKNTTKSTSSGPDFTLSGVDLSQVSSSLFALNNMNLSFTDAIFGNSRLSPGLDLVIEIDAIGNQSNSLTLESYPFQSGITPLALSIDLYFNLSLFSAQTDVVTIFSGAADLAGQLQAQYTGLAIQTAANTLSATPSSSSSLSYSTAAASISNNVYHLNVRVESPRAALNVRSRKESGEMFGFKFSVAYTCPSSAYVVEFLPANANPADYVNGQIASLPAYTAASSGQYQCVYINPTYDVLPALSILVYVLCSLVFAAIVFVICVVIWKRKTVIIRSASTPFCLVILVSLSLLNATSIPFAMTPSLDKAGDAVCHARAWCLGLGLVSVLSATLAKASRIMRIFNNDNLKKELRGISNYELSLAVIALCAAQMTILIGYSATPLTYATTTTYTSGSSAYVLHICASLSENGNSFSAWLITQFVYLGSFLVFGIYVSWGIKAVPSAFNESSHIASTLALLFFVIAILVPLNFIVSTPEALIIIRGLGSCLLALFILLALFLPKLIYILQGRENDKSMMHSSSLKKDGVHIHTDPAGAQNRGSARLHKSKEHSSAGDSSKHPNVNVELTGAALPMSNTMDREATSTPSNARAHHARSSESNMQSTMPISARTFTLQHGHSQRQHGVSEPNNNINSGSINKAPSGIVSSGSPTPASPRAISKTTVHTPQLESPTHHRHLEQLDEQIAASRPKPLRNII